MRDDDEAAQAEKVGAAVGLGIEPAPQLASRRPNEEAADLAARGRRRSPRAARRSVVPMPPSSVFRATLPVKPSQTTTSADAAQEIAALDVADEAQRARLEQVVRLADEACCPSRAPPRSRAARPTAADAQRVLGEERAHVGELEQVLGARVGVRARVEQDARAVRAPGAGSRSPGGALRAGGRISTRPAASIAPVFPAESATSALPSLTARQAAKSELSRLPRTASPGFSSISDLLRRSGRPRGRPRAARATSRRPKRIGSTASLRASSAPATISSGARSPPIASTATRTGVIGLRSRRREGLDLAAAIRAAGRADAVRPLGLMALRALHHRGRGELVVRPALVAACLRLFSLGDCHRGGEV